MPTLPHTARRRALLAAGAAAALARLGACAADPAPPRTAATTRTPVPSSPSVTPSPTASATASQPPVRISARPQGEPKRVTVTAPGDAVLVDAPLVATGLDDRGVLAPPAGLAGWYDEKGWPKPGYAGASILAGHVNTRATGPDTFAQLPKVRPGALVRVTYSSGEAADFVVTRSRAMSKKQVPKDDSIWDAGNPRPLLRLITCDPTTPVKGGHYVGNWVVWAVARA
ncbi:MAG: class F sortase [Ornithinibacter sp.]